MTLWCRNGQRLNKEKSVANTKNDTRTRSRDTRGEVTTEVEDTNCKNKPQRDRALVV